MRGLIGVGFCLASALGKVKTPRPNSLPTGGLSGSVRWTVGMESARPRQTHGLWARFFPTRRGPYF